MERGLRVLSKESILKKLDLPEGRLLLAFSGGSDSLFLMYALSLLAKDRTASVYINHRIRGEEELNQEIALNRSNAARFGIPLIVRELEEGSVQAYAKEKRCGIEAAARCFRYLELEKTLKEEGFDYILTAHHREDQIETLLMRLLSSAPFYRLYGIRKKEGNIWRPMLNVDKDEILSLLASEGLVYSEDSTNKDEGYLRNFIRKRISPILSASEKEALLKISRNVSEMKREELDLKVRENSYIEIDRRQFLSSAPIDRESALYRLFSLFKVDRRVKRSLLSDIERKAEEGYSHIDAMGLIFVFLKSEIRVYRKESPIFYEYSPQLSDMGPFMLLHDSFDEKDLLIDESVFFGRVRVRTSHLGDRIDLKSGGKLISDLECESHVPYSIVLEDDISILACFSRFLGGKDRISKRLIGRKGLPFRVIKKHIDT